MKSEIDVKITVGFAIVIFIILALLAKDYTSEIFSLISRAIAYTVFGRALFLKWIWKWKWFRSLERIHKVPYLEGQWKGEFQSSGNSDTPSDKLIGDVEVEILQPTLHQIKVVRRTEESSSSSFAESIDYAADGRAFLTYSYLSEPKATVRDRSPISYGTARLEILKDRQKLDGGYWTDVKTIGNIILKRKKK